MTDNNDDSKQLPSDRENPSKPRSFFDSLWWRIVIPFIVGLILFILVVMVGYNKYPPINENDSILTTLIPLWIFGDWFLGRVVYWEVNEKRKWIVILALILWNVVLVPIIASYLHIHL